MSRIAKVAAVVLIAAGCATQAPRPTTAECVSGCVAVATPAAAAPSAPSALAVQEMPVQIFARVSASADSAQAFVAEVAQNADAAAMNAMFALQPNLSLKEAKPLIRTARSSAQVAGQNADATIKQGDKLGESVSTLPTAANRPWNQSAQYKHYWNLARHELVLARNEAGKAVDAADVALDCSTSACARKNIAAIKTNSVSSAGATRQAEPLLRIALVFATSRYATGL